MTILRSTSNAVSIDVNPANRSQVLGFCAGDRLGIGYGSMELLLCRIRLLAIGDDFGVQVIAVAAALYMWTKMHSTYLERVDLHVPLSAFTDRAALFLERAQRTTSQRCSR